MLNVFSRTPTILVLLCCHSFVAMDIGGSAVGIASLGIQVCQGLLSYYDSWKGYNNDITSTYGCVEDLRRTFTLVQESLTRPGLDVARAERAKKCLDLCVDGLSSLQKKLQKLRTHSVPHGFRQRTWAELQKLYYPFRESTLVRLREIVGELRGQLTLALQVLQLDLSTSAQHTMAQVVSQTQSLSLGVQNILTAQQADQYRRIVNWLSPADPWTNHDSARRVHEPLTGVWLLQSQQYRKWKTGVDRHLWLHGKAGCGKTVLCYTIIEDVRRHCESRPNAGFAVFYFTFSNRQKQDGRSLLLSLVAQLGQTEPGQTILRQTHDNHASSVPDSHTLETMLVSIINNHVEVYLLFDAFDECPEDADSRQHMMDLLLRLSQKANNLKIFATSRQLLDIKASTEDLNVVSLSVNTSLVNVDIKRYIEAELVRDRRLNKLLDTSKNLITETLTQKADGM